MENVHSTTLALVGFAVGFPIIALRELLIRVHFAYQETKSPMVISMISVVCNVVLSILLSFWVGILGVTLATSLSAVVSVYFLNRGVKEMLPGFRLFSPVEKLWKVHGGHGPGSGSGGGCGPIGDIRCAGSHGPKAGTRAAWSIFWVL